MLYYFLKINKNKDRKIKVFFNLFWLIADDDIFPFVWKKNTKPLLCRDYKQFIFNFG